MIGSLFSFVGTTTRGGLKKWIDFWCVVEQFFGCCFFVRERIFSHYIHIFLLILTDDLVGYWNRIQLLDGSSFGTDVTLFSNKMWR